MLSGVADCVENAFKIWNHCRVDAIKETEDEQHTETQSVVGTHQQIRNKYILSPLQQGVQT